MQKDDRGNKATNQSPQGLMQNLKEFHNHETMRNLDNELTTVLKNSSSKAL